METELIRKIYIEKNYTFKHIAELTGINMTRVFRIISLGDPMRISEALLFDSKLGTRILNTLAENIAMSTPKNESEVQHAS